MKNRTYLFLITCLLLSVAPVLAQYISPPIQNQPQYQYIPIPAPCKPGPHESYAYCESRDLMEQKNKLDRDYKYTLALATSEKTWNVLDAHKAKWQADYLRCRISDLPKTELIECLRSAAAGFSGALKEAPAELTNSHLLHAASESHFQQGVRLANRTDECIATKVAALDDGVSSARDIALAVSRACRRAIVEMVRGNYRTISRDVIDELPAEAAIQRAIEEETQPDNHINAVLKHRSIKRNKPKAETKKISSNFLSNRA